LARTPVPTESARPPAPLLGSYAQAALIRAVERRLLELFSQGKLFGTVHTCIGQEFTGVAVMRALSEGDFVFSNHRGHGHYLARTDDVEGLIAEIMGKAGGVCGGRGGSQHLCRNGFFTNGIQGGIVPVAAGLAFGQKLAGTGGITVCFIGDGTLGEGVLYEALNLAAKWELPLLVVLENNLYAQSTHQSQTLAGNILARAEAFGLTTASADTWDPARLIAAAAEAASAVRRHGRPMLLRIDTYRLMAHSKGDDPRDPAEVEAYWARDPLRRFEQEDPAAARELADAAAKRVEAAVARAEADDWPVPPALDEDAPPPRPPVWREIRCDSRERIVQRIQYALRRALAEDERVILLGEDIEAPYGGAFKVTGELSREFPGRVINTPISEAAIVGTGCGLALAGRRPVVEIMFGDFLALAADQIINHASKFRFMYNDQVRVPLIVRTPMGGRRGYGPTHSQCLEKHFLGLPGTQVLSLHSRCDPADLYGRLFASLDRPTLVLEWKLLYGSRLGEPPPAGFVLEATEDDFPTTRLRPTGPPDLTILCYGGMLPEAERAADRLFEEHDILAEVIAPTRLYPLDLQPIAESAARSGRLLVAEEGLRFAAFGAEAVAQLAESAPGALRRIARLASPPHPVPACGPWERAALPGTEHIVRAAQTLVEGD